MVQSNKDFLKIGGLLLTGAIIYFFQICSVSGQTTPTRPAYNSLNFYYGDLHAHSGYSSDGVGTPEQAYDTAKANKNDFFSLTDHDEAFINNPYLCTNGVNNSLAGTPNFQCQADKKIYVGTAEKWQHLKDIAGEKNINNNFVALYGYEWTHSGGHVNIFEAPTFVNIGYAFSSVYSGLANHPDKTVLFAQFNHPQNTDFNSFAYNSTGANYFSLIETNNFVTKYPAALKAGWKIGAVGYGDNHNALTAGVRRYGVLANGLNKNSIISAIKNRQTFAVLDGRAGSSSYPLALAFKINNVLMGGNTKFNGSVNYEIYVRDDVKSIDKVRLLYGGSYSSANYYVAKEFTNIGKENTLSGSFNSFAFSDPTRAKFFYIDVYQKNSSGQSIAYGWSAPVWISYDKNYNAPTSGPIPTVINFSPTPTLVVSKSPTPLVTITPTKTITPTSPSGLSCSGGCYGSSFTCSRVACNGSACTRLTSTQTLSMCGWSTGTAYRCCK